MNNKSSATITIIIIIVVLAVIASATWYVVSKKQPSPPPSTGEEDQFKNWGTYRNEGFGVELKYSSDWTIKEVNPETISIKRSDGQIYFLITREIAPYTRHRECDEGPCPSLCESEPSIQINGEDNKKCVFAPGSNLDIESFYINVERGFLYREGKLEIDPLYYSIKGDYFLSENNIKELDDILVTIKFINKKLSRDDVKKQICSNQPFLVRLSFKYNDVANKVFVEENNKLKPLSAEEWAARNYKWPCVNRYYIEEDIPDEIINKLPASNLLTTIITDISDWKTYSSQNLGIEFKYPAEWDRIFEYPDKIETLGTLYGSIRIGRDQSRRSGDYPIDKIEKIMFPNNKLNPLVSGSLDGVWTYDKLTSSKLLTSRYMDYFVKAYNSGHNFYLEYRFSSDVQAENQEELDSYRLSIFATILSTFKFIK